MAKKLALIFAIISAAFIQLIFCQSPGVAVSNPKAWERPQKSRKVIPPPSRFNVPSSEPKDEPAASSESRVSTQTLSRCYWTNRGNSKIDFDAYLSASDGWNTETLEILKESLGHCEATGFSLRKPDNEDPNGIFIVTFFVEGEFFRSCASGIFDCLNQQKDTPKIAGSCKSGGGIQSSEDRRWQVTGERFR